MLYDRSLKFPLEDSSARLARREKKGRRPNAWAPEDEDVEECPSAKQHWCPVTVASEDMIIRTLSRTLQVLLYSPSHLARTRTHECRQGASDSDSGADSDADSRPKPAAVSLLLPATATAPSPVMSPASAKTKSPAKTKSECQRKKVCCCP